MAIAAGMKEIAQDIVSTREDRLKGVAGMKEETQGSIKALQASRKKSAHEFGEELARNRASRKREVKVVVGATRSTIKSLHASRGKESSQMHQELASGLAELKAEVGERMGEAQRAVIDMHSQREAMGTELRQDLAQSRSGMEAEVAELLKDAEKLVNGFQKARKQTGNKLRNDLAQARADSQSQVQGMRSDFRGAQAEVKADLAEAAIAWQGVAKTKTARSGGAKAVPKEDKKEEVKAKVSKLEGKLLAAIKEHRDGISLEGAAQSLGVNRVRLGRASRSLLDKGRILKRDKRYFPATGK
jgi:uncharacterized protein YicC (UPF0701 family)